MKPKLISFKLCPFAQRVAIVLLEKKIEFDIEYINLADPPKWLSKISPMGKVPVLQVDNEVLFESGIINEYLNDVYPPNMHPQDPLQKAKDRAWIEFCSELLMRFYAWYIVETKSDFKQELKSLLASLKFVEQQLNNKPFFNGDNFMLIDATYSPLFMRLQIISKALQQDLLKDLPNCAQWSNSLLAKSSVQKSVVEGFEDLFLGFIKSIGSHMAQKINNMPH